MSALNLSNVTFEYPGSRRQPAQQALQGVSLNIDPGEFVALLGPNGSGKSTLIRLITGASSCREGAVSVFGREPVEARQWLSVVFQTPGLDRHLTVWENLRDSAALFGIGGAHARQHADALLAEAQISDRCDSLVKTLSGGLARRVDLCRALLTRPRLLILDEPTSGLDPSARRGFMDSIMRRRGVAPPLTVLMSTHLIEEAEQMDRVLLMHNGRIVADGTATELRQRVGSRRVTVLESQWQPTVSDAAQWDRSISGAWKRDVKSIEQAVQITSALSAAGVAFSIAPPTLGDSFELLTGTALEVDTPRGVAA